MKYFYNGDGYTVSFSDDDKALFLRSEPRMKVLPIGRGGFTWDVEGQLISIHGALKELAEGGDMGHKEHREAIRAFALHCQAYGRPKFERDYKAGRRAHRRKQRSGEVRETQWPVGSTAFAGGMRDPLETAQGLMRLFDAITEELLQMGTRLETLKAELRQATTGGDGKGASSGATSH